MVLMLLVTWNWIGLDRLKLDWIVFQTEMCCQASVCRGGRIRFCVGGFRRNCKRTIIPFSLNLEISFLLAYGDCLDSAP